MSTKRKETTLEERNIIISLYVKGNSLRKIGELVAKSHATIQYIVNKHKKQGTIENKRRSGRPAKLNERDDRFIVRKVKENPFRSAPTIAAELELATGKHVCPKTISNRLKEAGYLSRTARKKPYITKVNRQRRLEFAKKYINKPLEFWKTVIFSDESKFNLWGSDGKRLVWRENGKALNPKNIKTTVKHGGGSVMVWGCMSACGLGNLHFIEGIMDKYAYLNILKLNLKQSAEKFGIADYYHFQQDNDPKHKSYLIKEWLLYNTPHVLETPSQSPDMNVIEHIWGELKRRIRKYVISNKNDLKNALQEEWANIDGNITNNLIASIPRRLQAVIDSKGYPTKY
ncbi:Transposable element Tc1 transposase [Anthophora quadrimaculata]